MASVSISVPVKQRNASSGVYCVSTIGLDEEMIRAYVRGQEHLDKQEELDFKIRRIPFEGTGKCNWIYRRSR
jgi:hypothetical protein